MEEVEYRLLLRDELSKSLEHAKVHADHLEGSMGHLRETIMHFAEAYALFEVGKESIAAFEGLAKANAQLEASLKSTGGAAGETSEDLKKQREELDKNSLSTEAQIESMQSLLLTFTSVHKDVFAEASGAIADMSAKMGSDMQSTTIQVGKALQDPIKGISALHRVGVNFSEVQKQQIENFVKTGQAAKAQQLILHELETEFGGSAKAALDAAPMEAMKKQWEEVLVDIGGALEGILVEVMPYIKMLFSGIKDVIDYLKEHTTAVKFFATVVLGVGAAMAWGSIQSAFLATSFGAVAANMGLATAAGYLLEMAQRAINAAMEANPIGIVIAALAALVAGIMAVIDNYDKLREEYDKGIHDREKRAIEDETESVNKLADSYEKQHMSKKKAQQRALEVSKKDVQDEITELERQLKRAQTDEVKQQIGTSLTIATAKRNALYDSKVFDKPGAKPSGLGITAAKSEKVSGNNHTIINVSIAKLVETLKIESQNIKDGATLGAEHVTRALISSVNQFQASIDT